MVGDPEGDGQEEQYGAAMDMDSAMDGKVKKSQWKDWYCKLNLKVIFLHIINLVKFLVKPLPDIPAVNDMEEVDAGCDDFGDDDDLGDAEAIQALTNAENSQDEEPHVQVKVSQKQAWSI